MNAVALTGIRPMRPAHRGVPAAFAALLRKDLRLAMVIVIPSLAILALLSVFAVIAPMLGEGVLRGLGLLALDGQGVLARIGSFAAAYWIISTFACVLSALAVAAGESSGRARHLLPILPVSPWMTYASKSCACALVMAGFLFVSAAVESMQGDAWIAQSDMAFAYGFLLANGVVWAFGAPLFARTFGGAFVVMTTAPMLLLFACSIIGETIARSVVKFILIARDAAPWFGDGSVEVGGDGGLSLAIPIHSAALTCSAAAVLAAGLFCAWHARKAVLCAQSVRGFTACGVVRGVACVLAAVGCSGIAAAALVWNRQPALSRSLVAAETYDAYRKMPIEDLLRLWGSYWAFVDSNRTILFERSDERHGFDAMFWPVATQDSAPSVVSLDPEELLARRLLTRAVGERLASDPEGLRAAARARLDADAPRSPIEHARIAELVGPRTRASVLLRRLAADPRREGERVDLIMLLTPSLSLLDPGWDSTSKWKGQPGDWLGSVDQKAWGLAPFRLDCGEGPQSCPMASARAEAVVFVTALEKRIEDGTFELMDARSPHDRWSVGGAVVRAARHALEPAFPKLGADRLADSPWRTDATRAPSVNDDQSLHLPASLLFHREQTDPSYLLR